MNTIDEIVCLLSGKQICTKCQGEGWLWGNELEDYVLPDTLYDDNKYTCDMCHGLKYISIINPYGE